MEFFKCLLHCKASNWKEGFNEGFVHTLKCRECCMHTPFSPACLLAAHQKPSLSHSVLVFFIAVTKFLTKEWTLRKEVFRRALDPKGYILHHDREGMRAEAWGGSWHCIYPQAGSREKWILMLSFLLFIQFVTFLANVMGPFIVREGHSTTINPTYLISMPRELFP